MPVLDRFLSALIQQSQPGMHGLVTDPLWVLDLAVTLFTVCIAARVAMLVLFNQGATSWCIWPFIHSACRLALFSVFIRPVNAILAKNMVTLIQNFFHKTGPLHDSSSHFVWLRRSRE